MKIVAHRGASRSAPENTLAAIRAAILEGADGVELDVRLTRDSEPVLLHDPDLLRTTGDPRPVAHCLLTDLAALDAGSWWSPTYAGERIPTLAEALAIAKVELINLDLKNDPDASPQLADRVLAIVGASSARSRCWLTAADPMVLARCRERAPDLPTGRLIESAADPWRPEGISFLSVREDLISADLVRHANDAGLAVWAWTVNNPERALALAQAGVAVLITDTPARLREALKHCP
ncbi:MAG: glycerophosphodiester phosphodiesterase family protein [Kiritimatiellae bacterium]|nr:glycerophosphodiester phosphodiesterase family protein [Kiritimatiellia bacterium]